VNSDRVVCARRGIRVDPTAAYTARFDVLPDVNLLDRSPHLLVRPITCATALLAVTAVAGGVLHAAEAPQKKSKIDFSRVIRPLLANKCLKCHGPGESQREGDLRLDLPQTAVGKVIVPGRPGQSELVKRITSKDPELRMPPPESKLELTEQEISLLKAWIAEGADSTVHWSFVTPGRPELPKVEGTGWMLNTIDRFVLSRIEAADLKPSSSASREQLIRRLTLDLTGLPPTEREIDRFLADKTPRAYERLVDRLLSSQHYGERMAQTWLDLARFGDTNGYENDSDRSMWLYRDWVINAFNTNMPFDRFALEQLAGDLLPHASPSQLIASGFNRNTTYNEEGGSDPEEFQVVYAVERASTTGTVFLGLTLGCAQCHEHKYDPISQEEFYSFYAFFNSVDGEKGAQGHDIPLPPLLTLSTPRQEAETKQLAHEIEALDKTIAAEITRVKVPQEPSVPKDQAPGKPKPTGKDHDGYFDNQRDWESHAREHLMSKLPKTVQAALKVEAVERSDEQKKTVSDHFIRFGFVSVRQVFSPLNKRHETLTGRREKLQALIPSTMVMKEMPKRRPAFLLMRGDFQQRGAEVKPDVPAIFKSLPEGAPRNRLGLARWLIDPEHPLTARVVVNRLWTQFFGAGLVRTPEDFGVRGDFPTHPKLLDWLAVEFVRTGWDVKALQKQIVMSATYRQASRHDPAVSRQDPYNRLLTRQNRFRLSAEAIRDTALSVSGLLEDRIGGPSVYPFQPDGYYSDKGRWKWPQSTGRDLYRRGLYTFWRRTTTYPSFQIFDAPTRETCTVQRPRTNTPLQALVTLNERTFVQAAHALATRLLREDAASDKSRLDRAFRMVVGRSPDASEQKILAGILEAQLTHFQEDAKAAEALVAQGATASAGVKAPKLAAWTSLANVLLNLDETITRE